MTIDERGPVPDVTADTEVIYVNTRTAVCDGGVGVLGHPRVFLAIDQSGEVECPYCSRRFVFAPDKAGAVRPTEVPGHVPGPKPR
jgi:uncharacterized Zn-finger protein